MEPQKDKTETQGRNHDDDNEIVVDDDDANDKTTMMTMTMSSMWSRLCSG